MEVVIGAAARGKSSYSVRRKSRPTESIATGSWEARRLEVHWPSKGAKDQRRGAGSTGCFPENSPSRRQRTVLPRRCVAGQVDLFPVDGGGLGERVGMHAVVAFLDGPADQRAEVVLPQSVTPVPPWALRLAKLTRYSASAKEAGT